jgi:hypothetical protein
MTAPSLRNGCLTDDGRPNLVNRSGGRTGDSVGACLRARVEGTARVAEGRPPPSAALGPFGQGGTRWWLRMIAVICGGAVSLARDNLPCRGCGAFSSSHRCRYWYRACRRASERFALLGRRLLTLGHEIVARLWAALEQIVPSSAFGTITRLTPGALIRPGLFSNIPVSGIVLRPPLA